MGFTGASVVRLSAAGRYAAAVRSFVAMRAVVEWPNAVDVFSRDRSNRSGLGVLRAIGPEGSDLKRSTKPKAVVEGGD
jgi:hypothetical protein